MASGPPVGLVHRRGPAFDEPDALEEQAGVGADDAVEHTSALHVGEQRADASIGSGRPGLTRITVKFCDGSASWSSVWMFIAPMIVRPCRPESRAPAMIGTISPIRREPDPPREDELGDLRQPELKCLLSLEKELTFLGEEQVEAGEVDLLNVDFFLREVGVDREIRCEPGRDAPLRVDTRLPARVRIVQPEVAAAAAEDVRPDLQVASRLECREARAGGRARPGGTSSSRSARRASTSLRSSAGCCA